MPTAEALVTLVMVAIGALAFLHMVSSARAGAVLAHQLELEERNRPKPPPDVPPPQPMEPIEVG